MILHRLLWIRKKKEKKKKKKKKQILLSFALNVKTPKRFALQHFRREKMAACPLEVYLRHRELGFRLLRMRAHYHVGGQAVVKSVK